ncbi:MAG: hypothetical protein P4N59_00270 [Negativicutes bacterium]|nr:hypothetical protein [Negativicutes bacterium]
MASNQLKNSFGSASVIALVTMVMLGIIIAGLLPMMNQELKAAALDRDILQARYLAEAGYKYAYYTISKGNALVTTQAIQDSSGNTVGSFTLSTNPSGTMTAGTSYILTSVGTAGSSASQQKFMSGSSGNGSPNPIYKNTTGNLDTSGGGNGGSGVAPPIDPQAGFGGTNQSTFYTPTNYSSDQTIVSTPSSSQTLSGAYYVNDNFQTNSGVNLTATGGNTALVYATGNTTISGNLTTDKSSNIILVSSGNVNINSGVTISGNVQIYSAGNIVINNSMSGYAMIESLGNITVNSNVIINKGDLKAGGNIMFNSGDVITGLVQAAGNITYNGAVVNIDSTVYTNWGL